MNTILHVDINAFFAAVEQQCHPSLRGKPVLVCGNPKTRTVVAACSYEAKAFGVKSGMSVGEALQLCPHAVLVEGNPAKYIHTAIQIFRILKEYSPKMEIFSIDEAFLDITDTQHLFGGARAIAQTIKDRIRNEFHLTCSVGIAPNKLLAKLASDMQKPDGLTEIKPEDIEGTLRDLPVSELCGIGEKMAGHLEKLGIRTVGELARYPRDKLVGIFGKSGDLLHEMGQGRDAGRVSTYQEEPDTKSMGHSHTLARDVSDIDEVKRHLLRLSEMVGRRLRADGYAGRTVHFSLRFADMETRSRQKTVDRYTDEGIEIYEVACAIMDEILSDQRPATRDQRQGARTRRPQSAVRGLPKPIRFVGVSVSSLIKDIHQLRFLERMGVSELGMPEFFAPDDCERRRRLVRVIDEINRRFGEFTIFRSSLVDTQLIQKTHGFLTVDQKRPRRRRPEQ
jgi:DNA polymerase-4